MSKKNCDHCGLKYEEQILIEDNSFTDKKFFCCKGCQGIYHLLYKEGLDSFYDKKGSIALAPPIEANMEDLDRFDLESFRQRYIKEIDGAYEVSLVIEGIHCSACVWLNEKVLCQLDGTLEVSINFTNNKAKIVWDPSIISLSKIIERIRSIGYNAYPYDSNIQEELANKTRKKYYSRMLVGIFTTMNIMWIAIAQYAGYFSGMTQEIKNILNFAEFVLATPTLFYTGSVFFKGAYYGLKNKYINMDLLVATGASLAYIFSVYVMLSGNGEVYFDSVTMIITFVFVGKYLEVLSKKQAVDALDTISSSLPSEVLVVDNDENRYINVEAVVPGMIVELKPGEKVVLDGVLLNKEASFDFSSITGESIPLLVKQGEKIQSGVVCLDTLVHYKVDVSYGDSTIVKMMHILEDALHKKPKIEQLANSISGYFSFVVLSIAFLTFLAWFFIGGFEQALIVAISVIVIACPCALSLATPVSTLAGLGLGAKRGILFKEAFFLENMAKARVLTLDKTGTITEGKPEVVNAEIHENIDISILLSLVSSSIHPISKGVYNYLSNKYPNSKVGKISDIKSIQAKGVSAYIGEKKVIGGNAKFLEENGVDCCGGEKSEYWFAYDGQIMAHFTLEDKPKDEARDMINNIKKMGIKVIMLTGDNENVAKDIAFRVGIDDFRASLNPENKARIIEELKKNGARVVMAGDGINDALALSKSDIAIAMGSGTDIAIQASNVVLMNSSLKSLYEAFAISRRTFKSVKQNITFSIIYNVFTIPLAVMGFIIPLFAALSMSLSSIIVILNAMRIRLLFSQKEKNE